MDQACDGPRGPRPGTASVQVREVSRQGQHNPCPQSKDPGSHGGGHVKQLVEESLSPARLVSECWVVRGLHGVTFRGPCAACPLPPFLPARSV